MVPRGGDSDGPPLSEFGVAEARDLAAAMVAAGWTSAGANGYGRPGAADGLVLLNSPLQRTRQTAQILGPVLGLEPEPAPEWAELRLGEWDGLTYRQIAQDWPDQFARWQDSPAARPPGGESVEDLRSRVQAAVQQLLAAQAGKTVVLVTHTGPIRAAVASALDAGPAAFWRLRVDPASVTTLRFWADGGVEVVEVNRTRPKA